MQMEFKEAPRKRRRSLGRPVAFRRKRVFLKGARKGEIKFYDLDVDDAVISTGGTIAEDSLITIPEGLGESERIGRKLTVVSLHMNWDILLPFTASQTQTSDAVRIIVYLDK